MFPDSFSALSTPLPPMLCSMANVRSDARFIGFCYLGSKATWNDGRGCGTFSFFNVWQPLSDHRAIALPLKIYVKDGHLGSDDFFPTHVLLSNRADDLLWLAPYNEAIRFLDAQHPKQVPISPQEWAAVKALVEAMPEPSMDEMRQQGMFEWFIAPSEESKAQARALVQWLDNNIDPVLENAYQRAMRSA
jgi:hypothetical protein